MAGRPPTPTAIKLAKGNPGKRAISKQEPDPQRLQDLTPPIYLSDPARAVWDEIAPAYRRDGLLCEVDVPAFAAMCQSIADYRRAVARTGVSDVKTKLAENEAGEIVEVGEHINPWALIKSMASKQMVTWFSKFGGTPADRTRIALNPQGDLFSAQSDSIANMFH